MNSLIVNLVLLCCSRPVISWEYAVSTNSEIKFFNKNWSDNTSAAHQFKDISAIAYDEFLDTIYFNDRQYHNGSVFSLLISDSNTNHVIQQILANQQMYSMAVDPFDRKLFWTDSLNGYIMTVQLHNSTYSDITNSSIWMKSIGSYRPRGIAVDVCRRKVYWTNFNPYNGSTIERASINGLNREIIVGADLDMPLSIVVDQYSKSLFWVDDLNGVHYSVESCDLDGKGRRTLVRNLNQAPQHLTVDIDAVYWTDDTYQCVWKMLKDSISGTEPIRIVKFESSPKGIIVRNRIQDTQTDNPNCSKMISSLLLKKIQNSNDTPPGKNSTLGQISNKTDLSTITPSTNILICLNNGTVNENAKRCICSDGFHGMFCEIPICHNYCLRGKCYLSTNGYPQCLCPAGFTGDRCEHDKCIAFCLNGGRCDIDEIGVIVCNCIKSFSGERCEKMNENEACHQFCNNGDVFDGFPMKELCGNCSIENSDIDLYIKAKDSVCKSISPSKINKTALIVTGGVISSLVLVYFILIVFVRTFKPIRPKIKKTFVVRNNISSKNRTPLTCRPLPDQCEITIENCCNMNICDTPCFDPNTIQGEINDHSRNDDKYKLLTNMESDLY